jgi:DNA repair photolyase
MKPPRLNPDGFSVKNCSIIYAPAGQAGEYSKLATNPYRGCGHKCRYCYVPGVLHITRAEFDAGAQDRAEYLEKLIKDALKYQTLGIREQVLLSFTTDPYHPFDTSLTRSTLQVLVQHGLAFCTLTKGGTRALRDLDLFRHTDDAFASSLTCLDDKESELWEPGAALPADRIAALKQFYEAGIYTWVSLEPVLDVEVTLEVIRRTHSFTNLYKVGRLNYVKRAIDWREFADRVVELLTQLNAEHYIKKDLQPYLPAGYRNELYRPQRRELPVLN